MKKTAAVFLIAVMMLGLIPAVTFAEADEAVIDFASGKYSAISKVELSGGTDIPLAERGGTKGCVLSSSRSALYVDFEDNFLSELDDGTEIVLDIMYYDGEKGHFAICYDSIYNERKLLGNVPIYTQSSLQWKHCAFTIKDGYFAGRSSGHDIEIMSASNFLAASGADIVIGKITVKKFAGKNPIGMKITSDEPGNIFGNDDDFSMNVSYHNFGEHQTEADVLLEAYKDNGDVVWSSNDKISVDGKKDLTKRYKMDFREYGLYNFRATVSNAELGISTSETTVFSLINSDPNGIRNDKFIPNTHYMWRLYYTDMPEILKKMNSAGVRDHMFWPVYERGGEGNYNINNFPFLDAFTDADGILQLGTEIVGYYFGWGNLSRRFPVSERELEGWYNYIFNIVSDLKGKTSHFEVWNEPVLPNMSGFPMNETSARYYAKAMEVAYAAVKAANPEAKVGGMSHTGLRDVAYQAWYNAAIDAGAGKYMDAVALHPYLSYYSSLDVQPNMVEAIENHMQKIEDSGVSTENMEIWWTEVGYTDADAKDCFHPELDIKANNLVKSYVYGVSKGLCDVYSVYEMVSRIRANDREENFGILSHETYPRSGVPLSATDAVVAMTQMNYMLADAEADRIIEQDGGELVCLYKSKKFNEDVAVLWKKRGNGQITLDLGTDSVTLYDSFGNSRVVNGKKGIFTFSLDESCIYIKGNFTRCNVAEAPLVKISDGEISGAIGDIVDIHYTNNTGSELEAEVDIPSNMEQIRDTENGTIRLKLPEADNQKSTVLINFKEGDKIVQTSSVTVHYMQKADSSLSNELVEGNGYDNWIANTTVKNYSGMNNIRGYIQFNSPESFKQLGKIPTGPIPPNKEAELKIQLPDIIKKGMYYIDYDVCLEDGTKYNYVKDLDFTLAVHAKTPPRIDGIIENGEWNNSTTMYAENPEQVKNKPDYKGKDDLSAKINVMWDEDNLYLAVDVRDNIHTNNNVQSSIWAGDSIQFGILVAPELEFVAFGQKNVTFSELGMALTKNGVETWRWSSEDGKKPNAAIETAECAIKRYEKNTVYELRVPWEEIVPEGASFDHSRPLGFSLLVNDVDSGSGRGWMEYASGIASGKDSTLFTFLKLVD